MSSLLTKVLNQENFVNLELCINEIPDPRVKGRIIYPLRTIIVIAICAIIGGANDFKAIERFGWDHCDWFQELLNLTTSIPSHDTFNRVFTLINPRLFFDWISLWLTGVVGQLGTIDTIRIDGKLITSLSSENPINFMRAWSDELKLVLAQVKVTKGSNEITTIPAVLDRLDMEGKTVTIDAIGTQTAIVDQVCEKGGDYVLVLKKNQHQLYEDVSLYLTDIATGQIIDSSMKYHKDVDANHGRIETRECWVVTNLDWLDSKERWTNLKSIIMVKATVQKRGHLSEHVRFFISSLDISAKRLLKRIRNHWSIENQLHWPLDVIFCEDKSTTRDIFGIQNLGALKGVALSLLLQNEMKISIAGKRARSASNLSYMLEVLLKRIF